MNRRNSARPAAARRSGSPDRGVTFETVRQAAAGLPGVEVSTSYGTPALKVKGKLLVRLHQSGECFVLRVEPKHRDDLLRSEPAVFYVTEHYQDHPWVLVRFLTVDPAALPEILERAWRLLAPASLLAKKPR